MEPNEINILAGTVFRHLEKIGYVLEPAGAGETRSDVGERNRADRIDFDFAVLHAVSLTRPYVWPLPHADARRDRTGSHAVAKVFDEKQAASLMKNSGGSGIEVGLPSKQTDEMHHELDANEQHTAKP